MNLRRIPVIPTLLVLAAVAVMLRLGFWQLDRMHQKEALLARYERAVAMSSEAPLMLDRAQREATYFRHITYMCGGSGMTRPTAGHNLKGETGWAQWAYCQAGEGRPTAEVNLGWSRAPTPIAYDAGSISGIIAPDGPTGARIVATQPLAGLEQSAPPNPSTIPNNHWSYAVQWFLFALTALVIYGLALRKRLAA